MKTIITRIKRLALALCFVTPLVSWAAVDYTDTIYEPWSYSAGCVVWRGTQNDFHQSTIADVAADGTVGDAYTLNTSGHPWQVFASNQNVYTSPGLTLVFDKSGYKANPDASFTPLSFGGLKVDALADETEGTPYSITGTGTRYTDFGRNDVATYFEFNKSFTVNRASATRCYGAVTIQVAQGATFKSQAALWAEVGGTVKLTGEGTVELPSGLYVNNNSTSTLDLSAATRPTITGDVTIYEGGAIALPAGTEPSQETPFRVCSGTLTVSTYNYVKIGDADPIPATLTVSDGAITGIEPYSLERTFTSDYPTVVPAGAVFTFQGGTEDEPVVLDARTVNGTLKTEGYFSFTSYAASASSTLEVVSGKVTLNPGDNWLQGTLTVEAGATFVNARGTDAVNYNGTFTANIYGTLDMGATRWSLGANNTINLYEGCTVTGSGQGNNGALDWIENITGTLNVTGPVTITAPIKIRSGATVNVTVDSADNEGLTLGTTIGVGTIVKKGAGLIKFTTNPPYAITVESGAFTFAVDATPTITYSAEPGAGTAMSMWYAKQATWKGTVVIGALSAPAALPLDTYGNANSKIVLTGTTGNCYLNGTTTVAAELVVGANENSVVEFNNGNSNQVGTFGKVSGPGTLRLKAWTGCQAATYVLNTIDNFEGLAVANNITRNGGGTFTIRIGDIVTTRTTNPGDCVLPIVNTAVDNTTGTVVYDLANAKVNGTALDLEAKSDGIYVVVPTVTITVPEVENATVAVTVGGVAVQPITEGGNTYQVEAGSQVTVTYAAASGYAISGTTQYTIDTTTETTFEITDTATAQYVAQIYGGEKYTTLQAAVDAAVRNSKIIVLANETDGVTIPSKEISFYIYTGAFTTGEILDATGDYITTRTTEEISISDDIHADKVTATKYNVAAAFMAVTIDGTRTLYGQANYNVALTAANAGPIGTKIEFLSIDDPSSFAEYLPMFDYDSETGVYTKVANPVAAVYSGIVQQLSVHRTLAEAVAAAENGLTVKLLADVTLDSTLTLPAGKTLTMDLGGFTIYSGNDSSKRIVVNGTVTMTNGVVDGQTTVYDPNNGTAMIRVNGSLTLGANLTIRNTINAVAAFGTGSLTVNGATINALGFAISTNGSATGDNASNGTVLAINSGTITSTDVAVYLPSGTMTINGGTITGSTGVYAKGGSLSVPSTSTAVITGNGANAGWSYNGSGANSTGDALVIDNSAYPYGPATATIAGGTYESTNGDAIGNYTKDAETLPTATGFVTGGTFSSDVSAFCAPGYTAVEEDGVWTVEALPVIATATWDGSRTATSMFGGYNPIYVDPRVTPLCGKAYVGIASYKRTGASATTPWSAAAAEGVTVTYTLAEGDDAIATINGDEITFTATGSVTLTATLTESSGAQFAKNATITCKTAVAEVNDTVYGTLSDALKAAGNISPSAKVSLIGEGAVISGTVSKGDVTLDLAGYTITDTGSTANTMKITVSGGKLTVVNTEAEGGIETANAITAGKPVFTVTNGELVLGTGLTVDATDDRIIAYINPTKEANVATVTVDGATLRKTETATYAVIQGHGNDAGTATVNVRSGLVSTTGLAGMYCPAQHTTVNVTGGTVVGKTGIYVKNGTLNITGGAVEGTGAAVAYKYTSSGFSTTGDALVIDSCGFPGGSATVSVTGGTFTSANGAAVASYAKCDDLDYATVTDYVPVTGFITGGTFDSDPSAYVADGYAATESAGVWTVAAKSGIDPTDPTSKQEVTPSEQEIADAGSAEAAAKAKATVTIPEAVATATGVTAETYKSYFTLSATETSLGSGVYEVAIANLNKDVVFPTTESDDLTADLADVLDVAAGADVEITTAKPGLYYSIEAAENVGFTSGKVEGARELAKTATVSPKKPTVTGTPTAVFYRVKVSTTQE